MITLREVVAALQRTDEELTVYAAGGPDASPSSSAVVALDPDEGGVPIEAATAGLSYVLDVAQALRVLDVWSDWRDGREPTVDEQCEAILYYAKHDAYLPA